MEPRSAINGGRQSNIRHFDTYILEQLRLMESTLAAIVKDSDDAIISKDLNGVVTSWNEAAERMFGWSASEIIGRSILTLIPAHLQQQELAFISQLRNGDKIAHCETVHRCKNGQLIHVCLTISPVRNDVGEVVGASKICRDITERKAIEASLIASEKIATVGRLLSTVMHEMNNPLDAVGMNLYMLEHGKPEDVREFAQRARAQLDCAIQISKNTLDFVRESTTLIPVQPKFIMQSVIELFQPRISKERQIVSTRFTTEAYVDGFPGEMRQLFANIFRNALEAAGVGGEISVHIHDSTDGSGRDGMRVVVCDSGTGVPDDVRKNLGKAFVTTKGMNGTGLGLWISKQIVDKHTGTIRVRNKLRRGGAVFSIFFPTRIVGQEQPQQQGETNVA